MRDERERAEEWLEEHVAPARKLMSTEDGRAGARMTFDEWAEGERRLMEFLLQPIDQYIGLTIQEAEELAGREGRQIADRTLSVGRRANWVSNRINVRTGPDGRVVEAVTDGKPWDAPKWQPPQDPPQMTDGGGTLDLLTAEEISAALTATGQVLEVRFSQGQMICRYDPAVVDPGGLDQALRERLGEGTAEHVRYVPVVSPGRLTELMRVVGNRAWHPAATSVGLVAGINWEREVVEVTLNRRTPPDVVEALQVLGGGAVAIRLVD